MKPTVIKLQKFDVTKSAGGKKVEKTAIAVKAELPKAQAKEAPAAPIKKEATAPVKVIAEVKTATKSPEVKVVPVEKAAATVEKKPTVEVAAPKAPVAAAPVAATVTAQPVPALVVPQATI